MKFTAQEEIGLRCMLQMARRPARSVNIETIAAKENLSSAYVAKMMRLLRIANLVRSLRGQKGGYRLTRNPSNIFLKDVFAALGDRFHTIDDCKRYTGKGRRCVHEKDCSIRPLWQGIDLLIRGFLSECKLSDLVGDERQTTSWARAEIMQLPALLKRLNG